MALMDRPSIERSDFPTAADGYERSEVERHLSVVADALEEHRREAPESTATVAADRVKEISDAATATVREIVAAAERSAEEILASARADATATREAAERDGVELRRTAEEDAQRLIEGSEREASERVEQAHARAAAHLETVAAAKSLLERFGVSATSLLAELAAFDARDSGGAEQSAADSVPWRERTHSNAARGTDSSPAPATAAAPAVEPRVGRFNAQRPNRVADERPTAGAAGQRAQKMSMTAFEMVIRGTPREQIAAQLENQFKLGDGDRDLLGRTLDQALAKGANWSTGKPSNGGPPRRRGFLRR